jgi:flagellar protein FlaG
MSVSRVSEKVSQPLVNSFEPVHERDIKAQDSIQNLLKDAKPAESASRASVKPEDVQGEIEKLNRMVKVYNNKINFDIDSKTNQVVVKVVNGETDKIIRQVPPDEIINLSQRMDELRGMIFDDGG